MANPTNRLAKGEKKTWSVPTRSPGVWRRRLREAKDELGVAEAGRWKASLVAVRFQVRHRIGHSFAAG
jgi:hypothetical protein